MNPKLYRFFKHFTALLIVALFVANCEKDDVLSSSDDKTQMNLVKDLVKDVTLK